MRIISKDIRKLAGTKLKHYTVTQGATCDSGRVFMVFEQKANKKKNRPHRCKIVVYDMESGTVLKVSDPIKAGHGNDVTIRDGILYITHSEGSKVVHRVRASDLKQLKGIKVKVPKKFKTKGIKAFNGISVYGSGYLLRVMGGSGMVVVNQSFKVTRFFRCKPNYKTSQGMTVEGKTIVRAFSQLQSGKNYLVEYSIKGEQKNRLKVKLDGEMEAVFIHNGKRYVTTYLKDKGKCKAFIAEV